MKPIFQAAVIAFAVTAPALAHAQYPQAPVTRAEVRADLIRLEQTGYRPSRVGSDYPNDLQAAEAKVAVQQMGNAGEAQPSATEAQSQSLAQ